MKLPKLLSTRGTGRLRFLVLPVLLLGMVLLAANFWIVHRGSRQLVQQFDRLPVRAVGLVLGTAPTLGKESRPNPFFEGRMETAARLYHAGKVRHLLLSGDHGRTHYNEPAAMRAALLVRGVPEKAITLDAAGFRTLDSMARAGAVFGLKEVTVITDDFHQPRALFLARAFGLNAVGFPSASIAWKWSFKTRIREWGSRFKACLDVYLLRKEPRFPGPRIPIVETPEEGRPEEKVGV